MFFNRRISQLGLMTVAAATIALAGSAAALGQSRAYQRHQSLLGRYNFPPHVQHGFVPQRHFIIAPRHRHQPHFHHAPFQQHGQLGIPGRGGPVSRALGQVQAQRGQFQLHRHPHWR